MEIEEKEQHDTIKLFLRPADETGPQRDNVLIREIAEAPTEMLPPLTDMMRPLATTDMMLPLEDFASPDQAAQ